MEEQVRSLLRQWEHDDEKFAQGVENCARAFGDRVYPEVLQCLTGKEFDLSQARAHWERALAHRAEFFPAQPNGMIRPALLHYLHHLAGALQDPRILEAEQLQAIRQASFTDGLTGLYNQTYFKTCLEKVLANSQRHPEQNQFAVVMMDLDCFKQYNDRCGHLAGDQALSLVAEAIQCCIRQGDVAARYGGEEFVVLLHRVNLQQAFTVADRIRRAVEETPFAQQNLLDRRNLTISAGIAVFPEDGNNASKLLNRADKQLYQAKKQRNEVCPGQANQRRSFRHRLQSVVEFSPAENQTFYTGMAFDISKGGIAIGCDIDFQLGSTLQLRFRRPFWPVDCLVAGKVRHVARETKNGIIRVGLEFEASEEIVHPLLPAGGLFGARTHSAQGQSMAL